MPSDFCAGAEPATGRYLTLYDGNVLVVTLVAACGRTATIAFDQRTTQQFATLLRQAPVTIRSNPDADGRQLWSELTWPEVTAVLVSIGRN